MSDRGDDGFQPHPGDPWHPGWQADDETAPEPEQPKKGKRGLFRRRREEEPAPETSEIEEVEGTPPPEYRSDGAADDVEVEVDPPVDGPLPAWLSDTDPDEGAALPVDLPAWASSITGGAEGVDGGFVEPEVDEGETEPFEAPAHATPVSSIPEVDADLEPGPEAVVAEEPPIPDDLAAALAALGSDGAEIEVIDGVSDDIDEPEFADLEALAALADGSRDPTPEQAAAASEFGVAGPEAFEALRELDEGDDDLSDWEEFAAAPTAERSAPSPAAIDEPEIAETPAADEPARRGIWPFRRRSEEPEAEVGVEEAAEWEDDGTAIPAQWFADIDEDEVVAPPAHLPETEWPVAEAVEQPPAGGAPAAEYQPEGTPEEPVVSPEPEDEPLAVVGTDHASADTADLDPGTPAMAEEEHEASDDSVIVETPLGYETRVERVDDEPASTDDELWDAQSQAEIPMAYASPGDADDSADDWDEEEPEVTRGLELGFDDGTGEFDPVRRAAFEEEDDEEDGWVTGPVDLDDGYDDDPTEVLPAGYASIEHLSDSIYRTSATVEHRGLAEEIFLAGDEEREWQAISAAMPGVETGVVGFDDVADLGTDEEYHDTRVRSDIGTRVLTGAVLAGFFLGSLWVAPEALAGFIGIILLLGMGELFATLRRRGLRPLSLFGLLGGIAMLAATWFHGPVAIPATLALTAVATFFVFAFSPVRHDALTNGGLTVLGLGWVVGAAAFAYPIVASENYRALVLAIVFVTACMDIGAYAVGRAWGSRALAPVLSPNKSMEGLIGGVGACMIAAAGVGSLFEPFDLMSGIGLGLVVAIAAPLGDLAESMVKRSLGVKDMGSILPGHGGILDRVDALLFVIPAAWVFYQFAGLLG